MGRGSDRRICLAGEWLVGWHSRQSHLVLRRRRRPRRFQPNIPAAIHRLYDTAGVDVYASERKYLRLETGEWLAPINFMVAKIVKIEEQSVSIVGGVRYWADFPDTGPHGFGGRLGMTFLFPAR